MTLGRKAGATRGRRLVLCGAALLVAMQGAGALARGGHGGGHSGGGGHYGGGYGGYGGYVSRPAYAPRAVFYAAPIYYPAAYYPPPYYPPAYPPAYYAPAQPPLAYYPPVEAAPPPPPSPYPPAGAGPAAAPASPIYSCRDASGRTSITNRPEDMAGRDCREFGTQNTPPPAGNYRAQDATRYRFFCPDSRKYYPEVNYCNSAWLRVVPDSAANAR